MTPQALIRDPMTRTTVLMLGFVAFAGATVANPSIGEVSFITEGLINTAIAYEIDQRCDSLDGRMVAGVNFLWSLKNHAADLGYSDDEIKAYIDNDSEKDRLEAIARQRLRDMGAVEGEWETYCEVGRSEMAAGTQIGRLLR
jgi:hypothetical protein